MSRATEADRVTRSQKTRVVVPLVATCEVEIEVEYQDGEDPCALTDEEWDRAISLGEAHPRWRVESSMRIRRAEKS